jgi:hypothetical protein
MPIFKRSLLARLIAFMMPGIVEGGEGGGSPTITPELQSIIDKAVSTATTALSAKNAELLTEKRGIQERLRQFGDADPEAVNSILKKFASDEEAGLLKAGKIDEVLNKRTERMQAENAKATKVLETRADKAEKKAASLAKRALGGVLLDATKGALAEAKEDILLRGERVWSLDDDGNPVAMNGDEVVLGKDGKTPLTPIEWAESLRETAPHLWPKAQGSNAPGGNSSSRTTGQDIFKLPARERLTAARAQRK